MAEILQIVGIKAERERNEYVKIRWCAFYTYKINYRLNTDQRTVGYPTGAPVFKRSRKQHVRKEREETQFCIFPKSHRVHHYVSYIAIYDIMIPIGTHQSNVHQTYTLEHSTMFFTSINVLLTYNCGHGS